MRVALIGRSSLYSVTGGDTIQMVKTAAELQKLGVKANIHLAPEQVNYNEYDLLHFFNILRPADHLRHIRKSGKPYLVSTIYLDYSAFDRQGRAMPYRLAFRMLGKHRSEYLKNLYRFARSQDKMVSRDYLFGHRRAMLKILKRASFILPNSHSEYRRLTSELDFNGKYKVVPNGIDVTVFSNIPSGIGREAKVLCVAQVYGMKNQHRLILACRNLGVSLEIIGKTPPNHKFYLDYCKKLGAKGTKFIDFMPQEELIKHYAAAKVHALPSWFETTGLSSLEAGAMGCNLVVGTGGDTKEYFKDMAWYCEANDQPGIESALEQALNCDSKPELRDLILSEYTWQKAAEKTKEAYLEALNGY